MRILDRYIAAAILRAALVVGLAAAGLSLVSSFLGEADNIGSGDYGLLALSLYALLKLPGHLHSVLPIIALLGSLLGLGGLAAGSELTVVRAAGVSILRLAWSVAKVGLLLALVAVVLGEWLAPRATGYAETLREQARHGERVQALEGGLWLREDGATVRIDGTLSTEVLVGVAVYRSGGDGKLESILRAERAVYEDGHWWLEQVAITRFGEAGLAADRVARMPWQVALQPEFLRLTIVNPEELSSLGLYRYIGYLERNNVAAEPYRLALWRNLVNPLLVLVMTVFALPFTFGALRSGGAGQRLFVGGLAGLVFFTVNEIVTAGGQVYGLPPWLAAAAPTLALAAATIVWLRRLR